MVNNSSNPIIISGNPGQGDGSGSQYQSFVNPGQRVDHNNPVLGYDPKTGKTGWIYDVDFVDFDGDGIPDYSDILGTWPFGEKILGNDKGAACGVRDNPLPFGNSFFPYPAGWK